MRPRLHHIIVVAWLAVCCLAKAQTLAPGVSLTPVSQGYTLLNIGSFERQNLLTVGTTQYVAFYGISTNVTVGRRTLGTTNWTFYASNLTPDNTTDGHDVVSIGVSGDGVLHCAWGMHNNSLNYARTAPGSLTLVPTNMTGAETSVTYPQFIQCPNGDELFIFREGGSGAGDTYLNRWSSTTHSWTNVNYSGGIQPFIKGTTGNSATDCNAYPNFECFDSKTNLQVTWTWREDASTIDWNHDTLYARTPDYGVTWQTWNGTNYTLPITKATADNIWPIATNHQVINQSGQCIDTNGRPVICNWWAPNGSGTPIQFFVIWNDGAQWRTNQLWTRSTTNWPTRPLIVCDQSNRLLVFYTDIESGTVPRMAWTTDPNRAVWNFASLATDVMNGWEFDHDPVRWQRDGKLDFFYQPNYGTAAGKQIYVLELDPAACLSNLPPAAVSFAWNTSSGAWSQALNWTNLVSPPATGSNNLTLDFRGNSFYSVTNDLAGAFTLNALFLNNAAAVTNSLAGNPLTFSALGATPPTLTQAGAAGFQIANALALSNNLTVAISGGGALALNGIISGGGALNLNGGTLALAASNSFSGGLTDNAGTLLIGNGSFGSGNFTANSGTLRWLPGANFDFAAGRSVTFSGTPTLDPNGNAVTLSGGIGGGAFTLFSPNGGSLTLAGSNFFSGTINVNTGLVVAANSSALGTAANQAGIAGNFATPSLGLAGNITVANPILFYGRQPLPNPSGLVAQVINLSGTNRLTGSLTGTTSGNQYTFESAAGQLIVAGNFSQTVGTGPRYLNLQGAGDANWTGAINNGTAVFNVLKRDAGRWILSGTNGYTGPTVISNGTLVVNGSIGSTNISTVAGGTLAGTGTIAESLTLQSAGTIAPGTNTIPGTLNIGGNLSLAGATLIVMNKSLAPSNSSVTVSGTLTNTGSAFVSVSNAGPAFAAGDRFKIFSRAVSNGFAMAISPPPGPGLIWTNQLALDGSIGVVASYANYPTNLTFAMSGNQLTLSWPATHLGWKLQAQTNALTTGLTVNAANWHAWPGSESVTQQVITINSDNPTVFFRLSKP